MLSLIFIFSNDMPDNVLLILVTLYLVQTLPLRPFLTYHRFSSTLAAKYIYIEDDILTLKALPYQLFVLDTAILQSLPSRMLTSVSPLFLMYLPIVSTYISNLIFLWLSHLLPPCIALYLSCGYHLYVSHTCPYQRSRFYIRCVVIE